MEVTHLGLTQKVLVASNELPNIFDKIDDVIDVNIKPWSLSGTLKKVNSKKIKDKNGDYDYYKELTIEVENIVVEGESDIELFFSFPDKKEIFNELVLINV